MNEYMAYQEKQDDLQRNEQRVDHYAKRNVTAEEIAIDQRAADARKVREFGVMLSKLDYPELLRHEAADFMIEIILIIDQLAIKCVSF